MKEKKLLYILTIKNVISCKYVKTFKQKLEKKNTQSEIRQSKSQNKKKKQPKKKHNKSLNKVKKQPNKKTRQKP